METVTIQKLSKTYLSGKEALKQLSLTLSTGEVFGFLGPNGAGKTTTVKLLTGVLSPSGGSCEIMGVNPNIQPEKVHLLSGTEMGVWGGCGTHCYSPSGIQRLPGSRWSPSSMTVSRSITQPSMPPMMPESLRYLSSSCFQLSKHHS